MTAISFDIVCGRIFKNANLNVKFVFDQHKQEDSFPLVLVPQWSLALAKQLPRILIFGLPKSDFGHNGIWKIIDKFSEQAHCIPTKKTINTKLTAILFIQHIFKNRGQPRSIIGDKDPNKSLKNTFLKFEN